MVKTTAKSSGTAARSRRGGPPYISSLTPRGGANAVRSVRTQWCGATVGCPHAPHAASPPPTLPPVHPPTASALPQRMGMPMAVRYRWAGVGWWGRTSDGPPRAGGDRGSVKVPPGWTERAPPGQSFGLRPKPPKFCPCDALGSVGVASPHQPDALSEGCSPPSVGTYFVFGPFGLGLV